MSPAELLGDHTVRMVVVGTSLIGLLAGALGCFAYLRRQSLLSDVIAHSALPGTLLAFLAATALGIAGRSMPLLILGAVLVGTAAVQATHAIVAGSRIRVDAAMAIVLTSFFGAGLLLQRVITDSALPGSGGIQDYLFGNASVLTRADLLVSALVGAGALFVLVTLWRGFALRTLDPSHATVLGFPSRFLDPALFLTIVVGTVIGVKAVGLVLMVAFVVTPAAAARQWTRSLPGMVLLAGAIGGIGSAVGALASITLEDVPTGPVIVLVLAASLLVSLLAAPRRGLLARAGQRRRARQRARALLAEEAAR